jgi:hypothetical protein
VAVAVYVTIQLWVAPGRYTLAGPGGTDLYVFESFLAHGARVVTDLENPLVTGRLNAPYGINMMANTSLLGLSVPLTPVTVLFGPNVAVLVALVLCLAGTASAWYFVLSRHLVSSRFAAFAAGALCGFAPSMISQAVGHVNFIAQFLIPIIGWRVIKLGEPGRAVRNGAILGALVIWQAFLNEEFLLFTAIGCSVFIGTWALAHRQEARLRLRPFVTGLSVAGGMGVLALAYPLYVQFYGPQSYQGLPFNPSRFYADVYSFFLFSSESLAGSRDTAARYAPNTSEENTFLGWPLMILTAVLAVWLWRVVAARAAAAVAAVFGLIALGREIVVAGHHTGIPGPYRYLAHLPLIDLSLPSRYALVCIPMIAILIALAGDRLASRRRDRLIWYAVLAAALVPIAPTPLAVHPVPPTPHFITSGGWRSYVGHDRALVGVPLAAGSQWNIATLRWSSVTGMDVVMPGGYFIGPSGPDDKQARWSAPPRPTSNLLDYVARRGIVPAIDDVDRHDVREDLRFWRAAVVVLGQHPHEAELRRALEALLGPAQRVDDVWLWDVRSLA